MRNRFNSIPTERLALAVGVIWLVVAATFAGVKFAPLGADAASENLFVPHFSCQILNGKAYEVWGPFSGPAYDFFHKDVNNCMGANAIAPNPGLDWCNQAYPAIPPGVQVYIPNGCNLVGDVQLWNGETWVRVYDDDPHTGGFNACPYGCLALVDFQSNATFRSMEDLNAKEGCGPGCKFTYGPQLALSGPSGGVSVQVAPSKPQAAPSQAVQQQMAAPAKTAVDGRCTIQLKLQVGVPTPVQAGCTVYGKHSYWNGSTFVQNFTSSDNTNFVAYYPDGGNVRLEYADDGARITAELPQSLLQKGCGQGCTLIQRPSVSSFQTGEGPHNQWEPYKSGNQVVVRSDDWWCPSGVWGTGGCFVFQGADPNPDCPTQDMALRGPAQEYGLQGMRGRCAYGGNVTINGEDVASEYPGKNVVVYCPQGCQAAGKPGGSGVVYAGNFDTNKKRLANYYWVVR